MSHKPISFAATGAEAIKSIHRPTTGVGQMLGGVYDDPDVPPGYVSWETADPAQQLAFLGRFVLDVRNKLDCLEAKVEGLLAHRHNTDGLFDRTSKPTCPDVPTHPLHNVVWRP